MSNKLSVLLFQPQIPPNTGNIIRLCANAGSSLHLIEPLGFPLDDEKLKRSGLDYHEYVKVTTHKNWHSCKNYFKNRRIIVIETDGEINYDKISYRVDDVLLFGSETKGLPREIIDEVPIRIRIPMANNQRSINLSNAVAIVLFEAWRQLGFYGKGDGK